MVTATSGTEEQKPSVRELRRLETRARLYDAAIEEISSRGLAGADVTAIANTAGVVRGTFYFHFPTKEHVLVELQRNEERAIVADLARAHLAPDDLEAALTLLVRRVLGARKRLGTVVFQDMLGLHFSSSRPVEDEFAEHPVAQLLVELITAAQNSGRVAASADAVELAMFFGTGLFALLATGSHDMTVLNRYVTTILKGIETR
ncbi:TetR/AcrR family transcriptional regulator [Mycobacterium sp.]|uniref:TetR/AcrR family transcriptional regulator n=1 Tax=Mycobacterium sp. TaxID=1785 RepID=UPI0025F0572E|nr:TetR/AcrR family transcriptional regulator [Mycobacterium sp.]